MNFRQRLILASRSPRRIALLRQIGLDPEVIPSSVPEVFDAALAPSENVIRIAAQKAAEVGKDIADGLIIGADTIVVVNGRVLGKPETPADAVSMLELLSGRTHTVFTGVAILKQPSNVLVADVEATNVTFRKLPRAEIEEYVEGGSPMDKAGAYGIQDDYGAVFVTRIDGCFYNVVGLPLSRLYGMLRRFES
jgi:septum formation protein